MQPSFVDGIGSSEVLDEMWPLVRETVDQAMCVSLAEIAAAIRLLAVKHKIIAEGAGAASVAAALSGRAGKGNIVCIISGGNIDASKLATILNGENSGVIKNEELGRIIFGCGNFGGLGSSPALRDKGDSRDRAWPCWTMPAIWG